MNQNTNLKSLFMRLLFTIFLVLASCEKELKYESYKPNYSPSIDASNLPKGNKAFTMFEDDEDPTRMYDNNDRWFRMNEILQVITKGKDSVQISLYSPVGLTDVKIYAKLPNYDKRFVLYHFTKVPAFHRSFHKNPLTTEKNDYLSETGGALTIEKIEGFAPENIEFSVESTDPLFAKFKKIKSKRLVRFSDKYHLNNPADYPNKFIPMTPVHAKGAITLIINASYQLSHPIYYKTFMNFDEYKKEVASQEGVALTGALDWHGNEGIDDNNPPYDYLTKPEIALAYANYIDDRVIQMAMAGGRAAWGGGPLASVWEFGYITGLWDGDVSAWAHEYSHHSGYSHSSNLANSGDKIGGGQQSLFNYLYQYLMHIKDLPFTDPDILKGWEKTKYLTKTYKKPVFKISEKNPFLIKYKGEGKWN